MKAFSLAIVGADYPNKRGPARRFDLALCVPGEPIELVPEPKNPADEYAVAVFSCRGVQLGYITAERAPMIGKMLREAREVAAVFQGHASFGGWARVAFDGEQPTLPYHAPANDQPAAPAADNDSSFYPDPVWDEE